MGVDIIQLTMLPLPAPTLSCNTFYRVLGFILFILSLSMHLTAVWLSHSMEGLGQLVVFDQSIVDCQNTALSVPVGSSRSMPTSFAV